MKKVALFAILMSFCMNAYASYSFRHISSPEGLPFSWIGGIFQDADGDMWLSSIYGAYCYDGNIFEEYSFPDPTDGAIGQVLSVMQAGSGLLYFGTTCGLFEFDKSLCVTTSHSFEGLAVQGLAGDSLGTFWIATNEGIFCSADSEPPVPASVCGESTACNCISIHTSADNNVWAGTADGRLLRYDRKNSRFAVIDSTMTGGSPVGSIFEDSSHNLWITTPGAGVFKYDTHNGSAVNYSTATNTLPHNLTRAIAEDSEHRIWIGTEDGLAVIDGGRIEIVRSDSVNHSSLNDNAVYSLYCDPEGNMWVGTFFGGINIHIARKPLFKSFLDSPAGYSAESKVVSCITRSGSNLLLGTENYGLLEVSPDGEILNVLSSETTCLQSSNIHSVCEDSMGNLWVGTYYSGLYIRKHGHSHFTNYNAYDGTSYLSSNNIYKVFEDSRSNLWIGTQFGGLYRYDYQKGIPVKAETGLPGDLFIWDILEGHDGTIWLACYGAGVWCLDPDSGYRAAPVSSEAHTSISLAELPDGRILVGTEKEGLVEINPLTDTSRSFSRPGGNFPDNTVYAVLCDASGDVWLSTNSGLYRTDSDLSSFSRFAMDDGLPTDRFNYNAKALIDGCLYFGSINGAVAVNPQSAGTSSIRHKVSFDALYINNIIQKPGGKTLPKRIQQMERLTLGPNQNMFAISFSDYDYSDVVPDFQYRLRGVSDGWNQTGKSRRIDFAGLGPGRYTLEVAHYIPGGEPVPEASLQIRIKPHWWQSRLAFILSIATLIALIAAIIISRFESARRIHELEMQKLQREKESEINDLKYGLFVDIPKKLSEEDNILVRKLSAYIFENISMPDLSVDSLCGQMGMSKSTLYRKLKSATGLSANEFILNLRIKSAAKILTDTQKSISEIAYDVGFTDPYYFSRAFKKIMEVSPKQWRSNNQK